MYYHPENMRHIAKFGNLILNKKIKLVQLADIIINQLNIRRNDVVLVNVSYHNFNLIDSTPRDLIHLLKMITGTQGTLIVPSLSKDHKIQSSGGFKKNGNEIENDDIFFETFKQMADTTHINLPRESFAVWGKMAKKIAEDQQESDTTSGSNDMFFRLSQFKAKIIGIGVPLAQLYTGSASDYSNKAGDNDKEINGSINSVGGKSDNSYQDTIYNILRSKSRHELSELFPESDLKAFSRGGIHFFRADAERIYSKAILLSKSTN